MILNQSLVPLTIGRDRRDPMGLGHKCPRISLLYLAALIAMESIAFTAALRSSNI